MSTSSHRRHPTSLEGVIDFFAHTQLLSVEKRDQATRIFHDIIEVCEPLQQDNKTAFKPITLVRLTFQYSRSEASRDNFLRFFFQYINIPIELSEWEIARARACHTLLNSFADLLVEKFFLPLKASTRKTPQPSPAALSEFQNTPSHTGTTQRVAKLRRECLVRDRYRCVISRIFDYVEAKARVDRDGREAAQDDDGKSLKDEMGIFAPLEVAHIIPHSLMSIGNGMQELAESKQTALAILNMFDDGVAHLIESTDIDRSRNALTLTHDLHQLFGNFEIYFEPSGGKEHTYLIDSTTSDILRPPIFPVERTLFVTSTRTIDPPSPRLLAVHCAIAQILHMSAAGRYIDRILEDLDQNEVMADGSTKIGQLVDLRLHGWWDGQVRAY